MSQPTEEEICDAVLDFVSEGTYPDSEQVVAAEFPLSALSKELELITQARDEVEAEISSLSQDTDLDIDAWILQAKQLHSDLEQSRLTAREIVKQHEKTRPLQLKVEDAAAKVELVEREIVFNQAVTDTLEQVQGLCQQLDAIRPLDQYGKITATIDQLEEIEHAINIDSCFKKTNVMVILTENVATMRREIVESLRSRWQRHLELDSEKGKLVISRGALEETISALERLDQLTSVNNQFQKDLFFALLDPILLPNNDGYSHGIQVEESLISVDPEPSRASVSDVLNYVVQVLEFLRRSLPESIITPLSDSLIPAISSNIISHWLSTAIPTKLADLGEFEATLEHVLQFTKTIESLGLHGQEELVSWTTQAPRLWLTRRRVDSLDQVRKVLAASKGDSRQVERIEKRQVSETDEVLLDNSTSDDWDAGWDDEKENAQNNDDEEDVSAWGLDDDTDDPKVTKPNDASGVDDDETGDAWGWGEDDEDEGQPAEENPQTGNTTAESARANEDRGDATSKEITLREYYTITDIIRQQISDFEIISKPSHSSTLVSSSGAGLLAIPTLILAMFKAVAPSFYGLKLNAGQMYLYNDSLYLADQVRQVANNHQLSRLDGDIEALEKFGKLAYSKEMQTQRTIVTDLLDGAQGFSQCSEQPFLGDCENAVRATVDRLRTVYKEWQPILSHSALLQAIGSLVSTVAEKIIVDIEDLGDISESQSQKLVSFCNQLSNLEDLFLPEHSDDAKPVPMTAVYFSGRYQILVAGGRAVPRILSG
ncbi:uncharacterized protein ANIA_09435 [Aspergillus nidulans FGSC A4]|uniref:Retrograde transport protein Dsl1 C-terminal domain-containing protein n=1 Tax=Emericella nidulans (strain FGSC A4 / ATCC 38163 / CBS 112.46 / NRRL 194 / M139) TaxID=227321 RepID=C8V8H0_EMENI|nr:hypothetical protein [Aspergillus nidulans FGSC A4]CBF77453.1 TPA: conserved hypothetical protein [Aspergillus nidulans FGSC A4]